MPRITIPENLDDVKTGYAPVPGADYEVVIEQLPTRHNKKFGRDPIPDGKEAEDDYLNWVGVIAPGEDYAGRLLFTMTTLKPGATFRVKQLLGCAGVPYEVVGIAPNETTEFDTDDALNAHLIFRTTVRSYCSACTAEFAVELVEDEAPPAEAPCPKCAQVCPVKNQVKDYLPIG